MSDHIRGRMRVGGSVRTTRGPRPLFVFEVVDTHRDVVLHRDNSCGFVSCLEALRSNVDLCRKAWCMGVLAKRTWCS